MLTPLHKRGMYAVLLLAALLSVFVPFRLPAATAPPVPPGSGPPAPPIAGNGAAPSSRYLVAQTAGFVGYVAAGAGLNVTRRHAMELLVGYVPESIAGDRLWQLSFKYAWRAFLPLALDGPGRETLHISPLHLGFSAIYSPHPALEIPPVWECGSDCEPATALHFTFNVGLSALRGPYAVFVEFAALDTGLRAYLRDREFFAERYGAFGLAGIGSLAAGIRIHLYP